MPGTIILMSLRGESSTARGKGSPETEQSPDDALGFPGPRSRLTLPSIPLVLLKLLRAELYHLQLKES